MTTRACQVAKFRLAFAVEMTPNLALNRTGRYVPSAWLVSLGGRVDVKPLFRDYVACIASIHSELRASQNALVHRWEATFNELETRFATAFPDEPTIVGLVAVKIDGPYRNDPIFLYPGFIERRRALESKNRGYGNFAKRYVTGSVKNIDA